MSQSRKASAFKTAKVFCFFGTCTDNLKKQLWGDRRMDAGAHLSAIMRLTETSYEKSSLNEQKFLFRIGGKKV